MNTRKSLSSYSLADGKVIRSPHAIEQAKLAAQKAERDRIAKQRAAELAVQIVADYKSACDSNDENSYVNLGLIFSSGTPNIGKDVVASEFYFRKACDLGDENGCAMLRTIVANACGEDSVPTACTALAGIYYLDDIPGVAVDHPRARGLYDLACNFLDSSDPYACRRYGDMLRNGVGGDVDLEGAFISYRDGCALDEGYSCNSAGHFFVEGLFVERDLQAAAAYYEKTCALGIAEGCDSVQRVIEEQLQEDAAARQAALDAAAIADTDGDGMLDVWENANTFNFDDPSDADEDADLDGISNLDEYKQGSDPRDTLPETSDADGTDAGDTGGDSTTGSGTTTGSTTPINDAGTSTTGTSGGSGGGGGSFGFFMLILLSFRTLRALKKSATHQ